MVQPGLSAERILMSLFQLIVVYVIDVFMLFVQSDYYAALFYFILCVCIVLLFLAVFRGSKRGNY